MIGDAGTASIGTIANRLASAVPVKTLLGASGKYSGACLEGLALGSYAGPEGSTIGCLIEVGVDVAEHSQSEDIRKLGHLAALGTEGVDILTMRRILMNPEEAQALIQNWSSLLRQLTRR
jgi:hypothetical protein